MSSGEISGAGRYNGWPRKKRRNLSPTGLRWQLQPSRGRSIDNAGVPRRTASPAERATPAAEDEDMNDYDDDILIWSDRQGELLRRLAAGERVNDQIDWENVVEEVESVGREQLHAVQSLLMQALVHMLKVDAWPLGGDPPSWRADAVGFRAQAANRYVPSMRQRISLDRIYRQALRALPETVDGQAPLPVPDTCPVTLDELLSED